MILLQHGLAMIGTTSVCASTALKCMSVVVCWHVCKLPAIVCAVCCARMVHGSSDTAAHGQGDTIVLRQSPKSHQLQAALEAHHLLRC